MTPEELDRAMDFIVQHQARTAVHLEEIAAQLKEERRKRAEFQEDEHRKRAEFQENEHRKRVEFQEEEHRKRAESEAEEQQRQVRFQEEERHKRIQLQDLQRIVTELLVHQSHRLDWCETFMNETREWQKSWQAESQKRHEESLARLDRILGRLSDKPN